MYTGDRVKLSCGIVTQKHSIYYNVCTTETRFHLCHFFHTNYLPIIFHTNTCTKPVIRLQIIVTTHLLNVLVKI